MSGGFHPSLPLHQRFWRYADASAGLLECWPCPEDRMTTGALAARIARGPDRNTAGAPADGQRRWGGADRPAGPWKPEPPVPAWVKRAQERRLPAKENVA